MDAEVGTVSGAVRSTACAGEFKTIAIFCCLGLLLSLVAAMSYGVEFTVF